MSAPDPQDLTTAEAEAERHFRRSLTLWAVRWALGMAGAVAIVAYTGEHGWIIGAAATIASISLIALYAARSATRKRLAAARKAEREDEDEA